MIGSDAMVTPTTPIVAQPHIDGYGPAAIFEGVELQALGLFPHSMTEPPCHSMLRGLTTGGLLVRAQIIGPLYADALVISLGAR